LFGMFLLCINMICSYGFLNRIRKVTHICIQVLLDYFSCSFEENRSYMLGIVMSM